MEKRVKKHYCHDKKWKIYELHDVEMTDREHDIYYIEPTTSKKENNSNRTKTTTAKAKQQQKQNNNAIE